MAAVAKQAGVSQSLVHYHFKNKAGLLDAIVEDYHEKLDESVLAVPFEGRTWSERERARIFAIVDLMYSDPAAPLISTIVASEPSLLARQHERQRRLNQLGARNFAQAQRDGELNPTLDPNFLATTVLGGVLAGITWALANDDPKPKEKLADEIWGFVARATGLNES